MPVRTATSLPTNIDSEFRSTMPKKIRQDKQSLRVTGSSAQRRGHIAGIKDLLAKQGLAAEARRRQQAIGALQSWVGQLLPAELEPHLRGAELRAGKLLVYADSAAWSSRIRYALTGLLSELRARDPSINEVRVRVRP